MIPWAAEPDDGYIPSRFDAAIDRGYEPSPDLWQPPRTDVDLGDWQEPFDASVRAFAHVRDNEGEDDRCGVRCDDCGDRMCAIDGPEPRTCGTTCVDCPCDCTTCVRAAQDIRADVMRKIEKESA